MKDLSKANSGAIPELGQGGDSKSHPTAEEKARPAIRVAQADTEL